MDKPSPDPIERLTQLASDVEGSTHEPEAALASVAEALRLIADELDAMRNPQ
ncbi:MAG: hypothetical protein ACQEWM_08840 [Actinomycetota bacterium]